MANEISVNTNYTFQDSNGTVYSRDITYFSDSGTTASRPKRYIFYATPNSPVYALDFGANDGFLNQLSGAAMLCIVNREESRDMVVVLTSASLSETRILGPGEWLYLDVCEGDEAAIGGGGAFTYGAEALEAVQVYANWQSCKGELLTIYKATS